MTETAEQAYARGQLAGETSARLTGTEAQLTVLTRLAGKQGEVMDTLVLGVQRLVDRADAAAATVEATANALEAADKARQEKAENAWTPLQRLGVAVTIAAGTVAALVGTGVIG